MYNPSETYQIQQLLFYMIYFSHFHHYQLTGSEVGEGGGAGHDWEKSSSQDSNSGCLKLNGAVCWDTAHKAIGTNQQLLLRHLEISWK